MAPKKLSFIMLAWLLTSPLPARAVETGGPNCSPSAKQTQQTQGRAQTPEEQYKRSYNEAECLRRAAAAKGAEWLETEKLLLRSIEEAGNGRWENALALAEKGRFQAEQALHQAEYEAEAWKGRVLK